MIFPSTCHGTKYSHDVAKLYTYIITFSIISSIVASVAWVEERNPRNFKTKHKGQKTAEKIHNAERFLALIEAVSCTARR